MGKFYNENFPKSFHKLIKAKVERAMKTLKLGYSDDIMTNICLQQIQDEDINPTFVPSENWNKLTIIDKANLLLQANFLKIWAVIDFYNMSFKEVASLYESVESFSNQDCRLDKNSKQTNLRPDISAVKQEITKDSFKFNHHANKEDSDFQKPIKMDLNF